MSLRVFSDFSYAIKKALFDLETYGADVDPGHWQGVKTDHSMVTKELQDVAFRVPMPRDNPVEAPGQERLLLQDQIEPNLPWADDHFEERVSRVPSNPGEQYINWPWWRGQELEARTAAATGSLKDFKFTHTYQERFWPKEAGKYTLDKGAMRTAHGIRYPYGDLDDVVTLLLREPHTRQGYMPIFFPEDTGAVHGGRIPCTLGYYFLLRNDRLNMKYTIRSCDAVRHFRDDLYLAARLLLWVLEECKRRSLEQANIEVSRPERDPDPEVLENSLGWHDAVPGDFTFHAYSFHVHKGDLHHVAG